ncbi:hypothetical protein DFJ74DRAFT_702457 [Hyaloraphidium curvatum]|nr:hypothetical protein DFJ74DRAFT_702457 [Hyaloraphidium curvatum]
MSAPPASDACGAPADKTCTGCRAARYCSAECQRSAWRAGHRDACKAAQGAGAAKVGPAAAKKPGKTPANWDWPWRPEEEAFGEVTDLDRRLHLSLIKNTTKGRARLEDEEYRKASARRLGLPLP